MKIVVAQSIRKREFGHGQMPPTDLEVILRAYAKGIGIPLKGEALPRGSRLVKLHVTTAGGARRIVFLVDIKTGTGYFLFYRGKNDAIGKNITIKNPTFRKTLSRYLSLLHADMGADRFTAYEIG